jgi:hypothetical protein
VRARDGASLVQSATHFGPALWLELSLGGSPAPGVVLAGTALVLSSPPGSFVTRNDEVKFGVLSIGTFGFTFDWFPLVERGWHGFGTLGIATAGAGIDRDPSRARGIGPALSFGIGWDGWVDRQWALGLMLRALGARFAAEADSDNARTEHLGVSSVGLGLSLSHH